MCEGNHGDQEDYGNFGNVNIVLQGSQSISMLFSMLYFEGALCKHAAQ